MDLFDLEIFELSSDSSEEELFASSSSSSESSSESDDEHHLKKPRVENFLAVINMYTDLQFKQHFRLQRAVAEILTDKYHAFKQKEIHGGRMELCANQEIYIVLWYLANTETYRQISDRFDLTKSSVFRVLHRVIQWIVLESHNYIKWPTEPEMKINQIKFSMMKGFPGVIGAIDGSHIQINKPKNNQEAYYNRKKYYSILMQAIVGPDKKFMDIHCGEPGAMHDARLFRKSHFYTKICEHPDLIIPGGVLLGDSAYPDKPYLITPYKDFGNLTSQQRRFNYIHSSTRMVVENAFGLLKTRFRRLKFFESPDIGFIANCVVATCVLHNICMESNDHEVWADPESSEQSEEEEPVVINPEDSSAHRDQMFSVLNDLNLLD